MTPDKKPRQSRAPGLRDTDEWFTPEETAAWLRVNPKLVYRLAKEDPTFPAVKLTGSVLRIRRSRLDRWLEQHHPARRKPSQLPKPLPSSANGTATQAEMEAAR